MSSGEIRRLAEGVTASSVCDAMARLFAHRAHVIDLVSPTPGARLVGPVATMQFLPNRRDLHPAEGGDRFDELLTAAAGAAEPAGVLVMSSAGHHDQALAGGKKVARVEAAGFSGIVCDGRLRDADEIAGFDVTCFSRGETVRAAGDLITPFAANVPVVLGGVTVLPGDWVVADAAGAVVVPHAAVREVVEEALRIEERDAAAVARTRGR